MRKKDYPACLHPGIESVSPGKCVQQQDVVITTTEKNICDCDEDLFIWNHALGHQAHAMTSIYWIAPPLLVTDGW